MGSTRPKRNTFAIVDGQKINLPNTVETINALLAASKRGDGYSCFTLNLDHLVKIRTNAEFRKAYSTATFVTADGAPVAMLARRHWKEVERTTGADLFIPLCKAASMAKLPIYLFGTEHAVLEIVARRLTHDTAGQIVIAGLEAPPQDFCPTSAEADEALEHIRCSGARICFVMLGAPKQELFAARAVERGIACGFVCVGAAADFLTGRQKRAPQFLQNLGLEWLWRMGHDPRRLGLRYMRCALLFAQLVVLEAVHTIRGGSGSSR